MSRKASGSHHGYNDVIGVALLVAALLLVVAQLSFGSDDISFLTTRVNKPAHNWIGPLGAYLAWASFLPFGVVGYLLPYLFATFGVGVSAEFFELSPRAVALVADLVGRAADFADGSAASVERSWLAGGGA